MLVEELCSRLQVGEALKWEPGITMPRWGWMLGPPVPTFTYTLWHWNVQLLALDEFICCCSSGLWLAGVFSAVCRRNSISVQQQLFLYK